MSGTSGMKEAFHGPQARSHRIDSATPTRRSIGRIPFVLLSGGPPNQPATASRMLGRSHSGIRASTELLREACDKCDTW
jgi:hypothetical protein